MKFLPILLLILFLFPLVAQAQTYTEKLYALIDRIALVLYVLGGGMALVVLLIGGITYMTAGGNEDRQKNGKKIIKSGLIGAAIIFCAGFILDLLVEFLTPLL